tara:strand:+ start:149 stop:595 length:447 start_codon:yes stop_codon:yes gene_type:complete
MTWELNVAVEERSKELKVPSFYSKDEEGDVVADDTMERTFRHMSESRAQQLRIPRSKEFSRKDVIDAFESSFELIGGIPRLASWAHLHPTEFYKIYSKLLPSQAQHEFGGKDGVLRIVHSIAPGALDTAPESLRGNQVIEHENADTKS